MSAEQYAALLEGAGHRVVRTEGAWWYESQRHWFMGFPFHAELAPTADERRRLFAQGAWVLRYPCALAIGQASHRSVCDDPGYGLSSLSGKARNQLRRGLENCSVRRLSFADLRRHGGLELSRSTLRRQNRGVPADHDSYWLGYYAAAEPIDTAECWGAFVGDELAASLIAVTIEDCANLLVLRSAREHLGRYPNNALVYTFTRNALSRPWVTEVSWGLESLLPDLVPLEHFKVGMGFEERSVGQRLDVTGWLKVLLRSPAAPAARMVAVRRQERPNWGRLPAMLEWYANQPPLPA